MAETRHFTDCICETCMKAAIGNRPSERNWGGTGLSRREFYDVLARNAMPRKSDSQQRKQTPIYSGPLTNFPLAIAAVARLCFKANEKHNPGEPLHWSRGKSTDHKDCIARHLIDSGTMDPEFDELHDVALAWRALANLQLAEEKRLGISQETKYMAEIIQEPGVIERFATNIALLTGAIATLAESINGSYTKGTPIYAQLPSAEPAKVAKPRGRPAKGEENGAAVAPSATPVTAQPASVATPATNAAEVDPFDLERKAPGKALELTDVRAALVAYQKQTSPETARKKLKEAGGVDSLASLPADKFQAVVDSLK